MVSMSLFRAKEGVHHQTRESDAREKRNPMLKGQAPKESYTWAGWIRKARVMGVQLGVLSAFWLDALLG